MYKIDANSTFVDYVDQQMVALMIESGVYFTFTALASAITKDLDYGFSKDEILKVLCGDKGLSVTEAQIDSLVNELVEAGIMTESPETPDTADAEMECRKLSLSADDAEIRIDRFDDMAEYFKVDPIHEVDPGKGWPYTQDGDK